MEWAAQIINLSLYVQVVLDNLDDDDKLSAAEVTALTAAAAITISHIQIGSHMDAHTAVYHNDDPDRIFFSPSLLLQSAVGEK